MGFLISMYLEVILSNLSKSLHALCLCGNATFVTHSSAVSVVVSLEGTECRG